MTTTSFVPKAIQSSPDFCVEMAAKSAAAFILRDQRANVDVLMEVVLASIRIVWL
jgi:hypothetical protein